MHPSFLFLLLYFFLNSGYSDASTGFTVLSTRSLGKGAMAADADMWWLGAGWTSQVMLLSSFAGGMCHGLAPARLVGGSSAQSRQPPRARVGVCMGLGLCNWEMFGRV